MSQSKYVPRYAMPVLTDAMSALSDLVVGIHEACESVTPIGFQDFDSLVESIKQSGQLRPIEVNKKKQLLDGRCRILACSVAGFKITPDDIVTTDAEPWAIAQSNLARRHLTRDQRTMLATKFLEQAKESAAERKREGAKKGRESRQDPLAANSVASGNTPVKKKRQPSAVDDVAKQVRVARANLTVAAKVKEMLPELFAKVASGKILRVEDAVHATVDLPKILAKAIKPVVKTPVVSGKASVKAKVVKVIELDDGPTMVLDRVDSIRVVHCGEVTIYHHDDVEVEILVYSDGDGWWFGPTSKVEHVNLPTRKEAEREALKLIKSWIIEGR